MYRKIILIILLYGLLIYLAGDALWTVLFFMSVPAIAYTCIKLFLFEAPGNYMSRILYGEQTCKKPLTKLSHIHILIMNQKYTEAYESLVCIQGRFLEVEKLKMQILTDQLNRPTDALKIGIEVLNDQRLSHDHIPFLGNSVEICIEAGDFKKARDLLSTYGPKMPTQYLVEDKYKRINALQL